MTTLPDRGDPRENGVIAVVGHHSQLILTLLFAECFAITLVDAIIPLSASVWGTHGLLAFPLMFLALFAQMRHDRMNICTACLLGAPADGQARAEKHAGKLQAFHAPYLSVKTRLFATGAYLTVILLLGQQSWPARWITVVFTFLALLWTRTVHLHSKLQPWCPYCHDDDDDDDDPPEEAPVPDPVIHEAG